MLRRNVCFLILYLSVSSRHCELELKRITYIHLTFYKREESYNCCQSFISVQIDQYFDSLVFSKSIRHYFKK